MMLTSQVRLDALQVRILTFQDTLQRRAVPKTIIGTLELRGVHEPESTIKCNQYIKNEQDFSSVQAVQRVDSSIEQIGV